MSSRRRGVLLAIVLVGLLGVAQLQHVLTVIGDVWWAILSWDSYTTHEFEALADLTPPYSDPTRQTPDPEIVAASSPGRVVLRAGGPRTLGVVLSGLVTRAPPLSVA